MDGNDGRFALAESGGISDDDAESAAGVPEKLAGGRDAVGFGSCAAEAPLLVGGGVVARLVAVLSHPCAGACVSGVPCLWTFGESAVPAVFCVERQSGLEIVHQIVIY